MKPVMLGTLIGLVLAVTVLSADRPADDRPWQKQPKHSKQQITEPCFSAREVVVIKEYYAPQYRGLPPGLQKKLRRTGQLPPGWQKKFRPFPVDVERQLVVLPTGYRRGVIEGHAVIFNSSTQVILDVAVLF